MRTIGGVPGAVQFEDIVAPPTRLGIEGDFAMTPALSRRGSRPDASPAAQPKLVLGHADDPLEHEANRIADAVMRAPAGFGAVASSVASNSKRKAAEPVPESVSQALTSPGEALDPSARNLMEKRFRADFSGVRVHRDPAATRSAADIRAYAYTHGDRIAFAAGQYCPHTQAGQRLLAHELAHVVQGRRESTGGQGVIRRYSQFDPAAQAAGKSLGWVHPGGNPLRVSGDGQLAAEDNGWNPGSNKRAWTTPSRLADGNAKLGAAGSITKLVAGGAPISGKVPAQPKGLVVTLAEVKPIKSVGSGPLELASDCGSAAKEVMGSPAGGKDVAVLKSGRVERYTKARPYEGNPLTTPEQFAEEAFKKEFGHGLTRAEAYKRYDAQPADKKDAFDRKYGINKYARPEIGQAITISTEKDMPGFAYSSPDDWNFHYAAVVLSSGSDYVTLESAANWDPDDWIFMMYGPPDKAQTFHEEHGTMGHGTKHTSMVVAPESAVQLTVKIDDAPLVFVSMTTKLAKGTTLTMSQKATGGGSSWLTVTVTSGPHTGLIGNIMDTYVE